MTFIPLNEAPKPDHQWSFPPGTDVDAWDYDNDARLGMNDDDLDLSSRRGGGKKHRNLLGHNGHGRRMLFPSHGHGSKGWYPRLATDNWWLGGRRWFTPYYERYAPNWYPTTWAPIYIYNETNDYVPNPELSTLNTKPTMSLPCFEADLTLLAYDSESLTMDEQTKVEKTLDRVDQQLVSLKQSLRTNPAYLYWTKRGFVVVPDLDRGCFVWAYTRRSNDLSMNLNGNKLYGEEVSKKTTPLVNERILFDVYMAKQPFTGFYITQDGEVYAYTIDDNTTFVDRLDTTVSLNEIDQLKDMLRATRNARVDYYRHEPGARRYWGILGNERMFIKGDGNSHSAEADMLVKVIDRILFPTQTRSYF